MVGRWGRARSGGRPAGPAAVGCVVLQCRLAWWCGCVNLFAPAAVRNWFRLALHGIVLFISVQVAM